MMKFPLIRMVSAALVVGVAVLFVFSARAPERVRAEEQAADPLAPLTDDSLKKMLDGLGYDDVKETKTKTGSSFECKITQGTWTFYVTAALSSDKTNLWLTSFLSNLPADEKVPAARVLALLSANGTSSGPFFEYVQDGKQLYVAERVPNRGINAKVLRAEIAGVTSFVQSTQNLWEPKWDATAAPAKPAPASASGHGPLEKGKPPVRKKD
jgi:hypothetical protein